MDKVLFLFLFFAFEINAASFNCSKANSITEKTICGNDELSKIDVENMGMYKKTKTINSSSAQIILDKSIKDRIECLDKIDCIKNNYKLSMDEYNAIIGGKNISPELYNGFDMAIDCDKFDTLNQYGRKQCVGRETDKSKFVLENTYKQLFSLLSSDDISAREAILSARDSWEKHIKIECDAFVKSDGLDPVGTMFGEAYGACINSETERRIKDIAILIDIVKYRKQPESMINNVEIKKAGDHVVETKNSDKINDVNIKPYINSDLIVTLVSAKDKKAKIKISAVGHKIIKYRTKKGYVNQFNGDVDSYPYGVTLVDNYGNDYKLDKIDKLNNNNVEEIVFGEGSIRPGETVTLVANFMESPIESNELILKIDVSLFGQEVIFHVPYKAWVVK